MAGVATVCTAEAIFGDEPRPYHREYITSPAAAAYNQHHNSHSNGSTGPVTPGAGSAGDTRIYTPPGKPPVSLSNGCNASAASPAAEPDHNSNTLKGSTFATRRRTWSPPTFERIMGSGSSFQALRSYQSNDQLEHGGSNGDNIYHDLDPPPRLARSGLLDQVADRTVVKPMAFKPMITPHPRYVSTPQNRWTSKFPPTNHSQDDGYASQDCSHNTSQSVNSSGMVANQPPAQACAASYTSEPVQRHYSHTGSLLSSNASCMSGPAETMVPLSSSTAWLGNDYVNELEAMLRERDRQILELRDTIEVNERAIIQVYEEKIQNHQMEMKEMQDDYERRLHKCRDKAYQTEQALLLQLFQLQQDHKTTISDLEHVRSEHDQTEQKCEMLRSETKQLKSKLEEVEWKLCQKNGEIALLKSQLKDSKEAMNHKTSNLLELRSQIRNLSDTRDESDRELHRLQHEMQQVQMDCHSARQEVERLRHTPSGSAPMSPVSPKSLGSPKSVGSASFISSQDNDVSHLHAELAQLQQSLDSSRNELKVERERWLQEKEKVIRYQKQLQLNYVQMCRKNRALEEEVHQLTLDLENRDISLIPDGELPLEQESMC